MTTTLPTVYFTYPSYAVVADDTANDTFTSVDRIDRHVASPTATIFTKGPVMATEAYAWRSREP